MAGGFWSLESKATQCVFVSAGGELQDIHIHVTHHNFPARSKCVLCLICLGVKFGHLTKWEPYQGTFSELKIQVLLDVMPCSSTSTRGADKSLAQPQRKQATATEGFDVHISYL